MAIFEGSLTPNLLKNVCNNSASNNLQQHLVCFVPLKFSHRGSRKYIKNPYAGKKRKAWNKPKKLFPNRWKKKLVISDKHLYYNQKKWINEYDQEKGCITRNSTMMTLIQ